MGNYTKVKDEFNQKLNELKVETQPSIYSGHQNEIIIYQKLMELQQQMLGVQNQIKRIMEKMDEK